MATNNATRLLDGFVVLGVASEVTHRSKRRLYGLKHLAPLREAAAPRAARCPAAVPGRPSAAGLLTVPKTMSPQIAPVVAPSPPLPAFDRRKFDFADLDRWLDLTDQAIRRVQRVLADTGSRTQRRLDFHLRPLSGRFSVRTSRARIWMESLVVAEAGYSYAGNRIEITLYDCPDCRGASWAREGG